MTAREPAYERHTRGVVGHAAASPGQGSADPVIPGGLRGSSPLRAPSPTPLAPNMGDKQGSAFVR